jgi:hypothetical protein
MWTGTRVPRNTGFPPMTLPFNRSLVGARVERISSARAPEMCPFSKTIRENRQPIDPPALDLVRPATVFDFRSHLARVRARTR